MTSFTHDTAPTQYAEGGGIRFAYRRFRDARTAHHHAGFTVTLISSEVIPWNSAATRQFIFVRSPSATLGGNDLCQNGGSGPRKADTAPGGRAGQLAAATETMTTQ